MKVSIFFLKKSGSNHIIRRTKDCKEMMSMLSYIGGYSHIYFNFRVSFIVLSPILHYIKFKFWWDSVVGYLSICSEFYRLLDEHRIKIINV